MTERQVLLHQQAILCVIVILCIASIISCKAGSFALPSTFSASFHVIERVSDKTTYNGVFSMLDGSWTQVEAILYEGLTSGDSSDHFYYYKQGQAMLMRNGTSTCISDNANIPPLHLLQMSEVNHIKVSSESDIFDREVVQCVRNKLQMFEFSFVGEAFIICADEESLPVKIIGRDVLIDIQSVTMDQFHAIEEYGEMLTKCTLSAAVNSDKNEKMHMLQAKIKGSSWYASYKGSCRHRWTRNVEACGEYENSPSPIVRSTVANANATKICVFLHGLGNTQEEAGPPAHTYPDYWGKVEDYTPQCKERWFIREESKMRGWDNIDLQKAFCKMALVNQTEGETIVKDKILFVHSMGNLILAGAIRNGICDIDVNSTSWYEIQGPLHGSKAAYILELICLYIYNGEWIRHFTPTFVKWVATTGGYCILGTNETYPAYDTLSPTYENIEYLHSIVELRVRGAMCGDSAYGLNSIYSAALYSLAFYVKYGDFNDGMVPVSSCGDYDFSFIYNSHYYMATINHADGTCRNSDGYWGLSRKPCSWYIDKV